MIRGCISASGVGDDVKADGIMNEEKYHRILIQYVIPPGKLATVLWHNGDCKHTANAVKANLDRKTHKGTFLVMD